MAVYIYETDPDAFEIVHFRREDQGLWTKFRNGKTIGRVWSTPLVTVPKQLPWSDFPSLSRRIPAFSQRAWGILHPLIGNDVEALPLRHPDPSRILWAINVLRIVDCLDIQRTALECDEVLGTVLWASDHRFRTPPPTDAHIFKTPQTAGVEVFISEEFRRVVEANDLKGLLFGKAIPF